MKPLAETQHLLWKLITAPEGVGAALEQGLASEDILRSVVASGRDMSAIERLDIYANMYFYRLLDGLKEDFPRVVRLVGEARFHNLVTDYLLAHPPGHWSLRNAGCHLPKFASTHALVESWPYLGDLARFEWTLIETFDAADAVALTADQLRAVPASEWAELRFGLHPSVRLLDFTWPVRAIAESIDSGTIPDVVEQPMAVCFWRRDFCVLHRSVESREAAMLAMVARRCRFGEMCEAAAGMFEAKEAAQRVAEFLAGWLCDGWLVGEMTS